MRVRAFARDLKAARRDRTSNFRESVQLLNGQTVLCESKSEVAVWNGLREGLESGQIKGDGFSLREAFEELIEGGREIVDSWNPRHGGSGGHNLALMEAAGHTSSADFSNITGQIIYNDVMKSYQSEEFVFTKLIPVVDTPFNGEKIAGVGEIGDNAEVVGEGKPYPVVGITEDWIETPATVKRGMIAPLTKEAIFFDRTGLVRESAADVGKWAGVNKEKRAIDCVIDENTTAHRYKWRGTVYASYQTTTPWDNVTASNALVDWTDLDAAEQTLNGIIDPNTGEPVIIGATDLVVVKALEATAYRILNATEVEVVTPGYAVSANPNVARQANPYRGKYTLRTSRLLAARLATDTTWFLGNIAEYARYMQNWPLAVVQAPPNSQDEFSRDIVQQYKVSERGAFSVRNPRVMTTCTA